jgi:hypothetical protein
LKGAFLQLGSVGCREDLTSSLGTLAHHLSGLVATETSTPLTTMLVILVGEVSLGGADESSELALILAPDILEGNDSSSLLVDDSTETGLALDNHIGYAHLATESGEEDNKLNGVNIMSNHHKRGLLCLNEGNCVVQAILGKEWLLRVLGLSLLVLSSGLSDSIKASLLLLLSLRAVFVQKLEKLGSSVLVEGVGELSNGGGNLETLVEDDLLALKTNIFRPLDEAGQVFLGLNILTNTKVLGAGLKERVLGNL